MKSIEKAVKIIKSGGVVIYPTETLYGLGANALDNRAVRKVFEIKGRDFRKPVSIAFSNLRDAKKYVKFDSISLKLAKKFLPGPLTLILPLKKKLPKSLTQEKNEIGIRIPNNKTALEIIKRSGVPLTATSANLSGGKDPITAKEAIKQIGKKVDLVLDAGKCKYRKGSTVVKIIDGIEIIREGVIGTRKIMDNI
jgi:L-threonylcarbamoyladenylate synthase